MMKKIGLFFFILFSAAPSFSDVGIKDIDNLFEERFFQNQNCDSGDCLNIMESIERARMKGYQNKARALEVYQAREFIKVQLGKIIPSLNLRIVTSPKDLLSFIPNLLGFLFPSNWFHWKESKLFSKVEELNFVNLLANEAHSLESLYLVIHQQVLLQKFLKGHIGFLQTFYNDLEKREEYGELPLEELEKAKSLLSEVTIKEIYLDSGLKEIKNRFAQLLNLEGDWDLYKIKLLELPSLLDKEALSFDDFIATVRTKSLELKSLTYMKHASKYSRKARAWSFLSPKAESDNAFGFGLLGNMRIEKAKEKMIDVKREMFHLNLRETLMKTIRDHNTSLEVFEESQRGINSLRIVVESMVDDYNISGAFDFDVLEAYLSKVLNFKLLKIQAQHQYLLSLSKLNRLLLKGDAYQDLERYLPLKKDHKFGFLDHRKWENRKINKDLRRGVLRITL